MTLEGMSDELFKKKLAYPHEYFTHNNFQEPLNLSPEDFWSTLKQTTPPDEEINRTQEITKKFNVKNGQELTELYLKRDVLQLAEVFENFVETATLEYSINPLYSYSLPGYTWKAGVKLTNIKLVFIKDKDLLLLLENNIRGGISSVMGPRYIESDENTKLLYIDANNLYGWAMSQYLPTGDFEKMRSFAKFGCDNDELLIDEIKEGILNTPDDNEYGYFIDCDLEYPVEIEEKTKNFPLCPYQTEPDPNLFSKYMNSVNQPNYKPTEKHICDLTNKQKYMIHYRIFKFYTKMGMKVTKLHSLWRVKQSLWLEKYIYHNTQKRTKTKTIFEKDLYNIMNE